MSTFQYGNTDASPTWTTETYLIRLTFTDTLYYPMRLEVRIANPGNSRDNTYFPMQKVRLRLTTSDRITFYGKILSLTPIEDPHYGPCIDLVAEDDLSEFVTRTLNSDYSDSGVYPFTAGRSDFINQLISEYSYTNNIYTTDYGPAAQKFEESAYAPGGSVLNVNFTGAGKTPLRAIYEAAQEDPWGDPSATAGFGFAYYLDQTFPDLPSVSPSTPQPHFHYFERGGRPSAPSTNGLICRFGAASETNQIRKILPGYSFPKPPKELITLARIEYVTTSGASSSKSIILVNHGGAAPGSFTTGAISWNGGGDTATVELAGPDYVILSGWSQTANLPGATLTQGANTATVNALHGSPPGVLKEHLGREIEKVIRGYHISADSEAVAQAAKILYQGGDTIQRGTFKIVRWPYIKITGTHDNILPSGTTLVDSTKTFLDWGVRVGDVVTNTTDSISGVVTTVSGSQLIFSAGGMSWNIGDTYEIYVNVRAGNSIRVDMSASPGDLSALNEDMLVTQIVYDEGPGVLLSEISVLRNTTSRGAGADEGAIAKIDRDLDTALWQTSGSIGGIPKSMQPVNLNFQFTFSSYRQVDWAGGTATYIDGSTQTIAAGNTGLMTTGAVSPNTNTTHYLYIEEGSTAIATTTSFADLEVPGRSLIAVASANTDTSQDPVFVGITHGNPDAVANRLFVNELSALTADMGLLNAGEIRIGTNPTPFPGTFTGFTANTSRFAGYAAGVVQAQIDATTGALTAAAGKILIDSTGITIGAGDATGAEVLLFHYNGLTDVILRHDSVGNYLYVSAVGGGITTGIWVNGTELVYAGNMTLTSGTGGSTLLIDTQFASVNPTASSSIDIGSSGAYWQDVYAERTFLDTLQERQAGVNIGIANGTDLISATAGGSSLGTVANYFGNAYAQTLYVDTLAERSTNIAIANGTHLFAATAGGSDLGTSANYFGTLFLGTLLDLTAIVNSSPVISVDATSNIPVVSWGPAAGNEVSVGPAGYLEINIPGTGSRFIPFWA